MKTFYLNINQVDAMRSPEIVAGVELEEDEEGEEKTWNPSYVGVHLVNFLFKNWIKMIRYKSKLRSTDKLFRKNKLFFQPPQKVMQQFFWGCTGP